MLRIGIAGGTGSGKIRRSGRKTISRSACSLPVFSRICRKDSRWGEREVDLGVIELARHRSVRGQRSDNSDGRAL